MCSCWRWRFDSATPDAPTGGPGLSYVDSAVVRHLRDTDQELLVAHSPIIRQILGAEARIVALWEGGHIQVRGMSNSECRRILEDQRRRTEAAIQAARDDSVELP